MSSPKEFCDRFPKIISKVVPRNIIEEKDRKYDDKWVGFTDYIDSIYLEDIPRTFVWGTDRYRRDFIGVKVQVDIKWTEKRGKPCDESQQLENTFCIFQRYTKDLGWVFVSNCYHLERVLNGGGAWVREDNHENLKELFHTGKTERIYKDDIITKDVINYTVRLL